MSSRIPKRHDFTIYQGATLSYPFFWYDGDEVVKTITAVTLGYPTECTATAHSLPYQDIPAKIKGVVGPTILNTIEDDTVYVRRLTNDTFSVPSVNSKGQTAFSGSAYLVYTPPKDLTNYSASMMLRRTVNSSDVLIEFDDPYTIELGGTEGSVTLKLDATQSAALDFKTARYDLEVVSLSGVVTRLAYGTITLSKEVTRNG